MSSSPSHSILTSQTLNEATILLGNLNYSFFLPLERNFESKEFVNSLRLWMVSNWSNSILYAFVYIVVIFAGQAYMRNRERYELRSLLALWNISLALFSAIGAIRVIPEMVSSLTNHGFDHSICDNSYAYGITGFWSYMFIMSKLPELIDTFFIVLRKQPLIFLHYYHHATVLIYCWYSYHEFASSGRWFMGMNYIVHSIMYAYYALKALKFKLPHFLSKFITTLQLIQMIVGCIVNYKAWSIKSQNGTCAISDENIKYSFIMYLTYFILFLNFFINAYIKRKPLSQMEQNMNKKKAKFS